MAIIKGTERTDILNGTNNADDIYGYGAEDSLRGNGGADRIWGGHGKDALFGGDGNDQLYAEAGDDWVDGGAGDDFINAGSGNDIIRSGVGNDTLTGGPGSDDLGAGAGNDTLIYSATAAGPVDSLTSSKFNGESGYDVLKLDFRGQFDVAGERYVYTNVFQDASGAGTVGMSTSPLPFNGTSIDNGTFRNIEEFRLGDGSNAFDFTSLADAKVVGGGGNDVLRGLTGDQTFTGGSGSDSFLFQWREGDDAGHDVITDFNAGQGDRILYNTQFSEDGPPSPFSITSVEMNGRTTYTAVHDETGDVAHVLDVNGVGLPPIEYYSLV